MSTEANMQIADEEHIGEVGLHGAINRNIQASRLHATQAAEDLKAAVEAKGRELLHAADDKAAELKARAGHVYEDVKLKAQEIRKDTEVYVKENPLTSVCIALGAGFVIGMLARR
jgi:ElaB/YqjD/DUF883 family membrane-anchored ribosome-binding protein